MFKSTKCNFQLAYASGYSQFLAILMHVVSIFNVSFDFLFFVASWIIIFCPLRITYGKTFTFCYNGRKVYLIFKDMEKVFCFTIKCCIAKINLALLNKNIQITSVLTRLFCKLSSAM